MRLKSSPCATSLSTPSRRALLFAWSPSQCGWNDGRATSGEKGKELSEHVINDRLGYGLESAAATRDQIDRAKLITSNHTSGSRPRTCKRNRETGIAGERAARSDWHNNRYTCECIEAIWRDDQNWPGALLLVSGRWIKRDEIDVAPFHNSRPDGVTSIQA